MFSEFTQQLFQAVKQLLPSNLPPLPEQEIKAALQSVIDKLGVVPRDEFDAQQAVLQRTRRRLEELEEQVAELEAQINNS